MIDVELLRRLIDYDQETGVLLWKARTADLFVDGGHTAEHSARKWNARYAGQPALTAVNKNGYRHGAIFGKDAQAHRVALAITNGKWPLIGDHISGDRLDNRIVNLRDVDASGNCKNAQLQRRNSAGVIGVHFHKKASRWTAQIRSNGVVVHLGLFDTVEEAAKARKEAEQQHGFHANHGRHREAKRRKEAA